VTATVDASPLRVLTASMSYRGPHRFDITRKSGGPAGDPFAPSWRILHEALSVRRAAAAMRAGGKSELAAETEDECWAWYREAYVAEQRLSYRLNRPAWDALLASENVVLVCYCGDRSRCHRGLLAGILVKLGAVDDGEVAPQKARQLALIG
jgi:hypothetical protein